MKRVGYFFFILFLLASFQAFSQAVERILSFKAEYIIDSTGTMLVKEKIRVRANNDRIRHGIIRSLPLIFVRDGVNVRATVEPGQINLDGAEVPHDAERNSDALKIRVGDAQSLLSRGVHEFEINYSVQYPIRHYSDVDELYWNVTGNAWEFEIDTVEATVQLPPGAILKDENLRAFAGAEGSTTCVCSFATTGPTHAGFKALVPLTSYEGFTIKASFPTGVVAVKKMESADGRTEARSRGIFSLTLMTVVLIIAVSYHRYNEQVRPAGNFSAFALPPAGTRFVKNIRYDITCLASALVNLHVKNAIQIEKLENSVRDFSITRKVSDANDLSKDEKFLEKTLFEKDSVVYIPGSFGGTLGTAYSLHEKALNQLYEDKYFKRNKELKALAIIGSIALLIYSLLPFSGMVIFLSLFMLPFFIVGMWLLSIIWARKSSGGPIGPSIGMAFWFGILFFLMYSSADPFFFLVENGLIAINLLLLRKLTIHLPAGKEVLSQIEAFKRMFDSAVATGKIENNDLNRFTSMAPYALALELQDDFNGLLDAFRKNVDTQPAHLDNAAFLTTPVFLSSLTDATQAESSSDSSSDSSSSSDSGSSGGGDGGGGGGGW